MPEIETVGAIDFLPLGGSGNGFPYRIAGQELAPGTSQVVSVRTVTPEYFQALRIPLLAGRMLGPDDLPLDSGVVGAAVINEAFRKLHWPGGDAMGKVILTAGGDPIGRVVGIVRDVRQTSMGAAPDPELYLAASQWGWTGGYLLLRRDRGVPSNTAVLDALRSIGPNLGVRNIRTMDEVVRAAMDDTRFYARLLTGFAALALLLGLVGVYGVMTYATSRRTREFGVRLAFGATQRHLLVAVLSRAMVPVAVGIVLGLVGALALTGLLSGLLYQVTATDPWVLGSVAMLLAAAAGGAALIPAIRAARLSPVNALQVE